MYTIITHPYNFPSTKILRDALQKILTEKGFLKGEKIGINTRMLFNKKHKIICSYGRSDHPFDVLNKGETIRLFSNKFRFSKMIGDKILTPQYLTKPDLAYPFMSRDSLSLSGGRGIRIINNEVELKSLPHIKGQRFFTKLFDVKFELRIHLLGGKPVKVFKKLWIGDTEEPNFPIRVLHNGNYHFSLVEIEKYPKLLPLIDSFNNIFGTDLFCALDVGWTREKEYLLFEANSAPGLNDSTAELYAEFISNRIMNGV